MKDLPYTYPQHKQRRSSLPNETAKRASTPEHGSDVLTPITPHSQLRILNQSDLTSLQIPERSHLIGDWLTERHPCMVYAQTGRGKSLFAMSLAIAVAGGGEVFGWSAPEAKTALYVDAEMDLADVKERSTLLTPAVSGLDHIALGTNLKVLARHGQENDVVFPDLVEEAGRDALLSVVREIRPALIILDNLSTLAEITDENDAAAFGPVLKTLWELRQLECAVILIHHTGKKEGTFRGSSKLAATFESILQLSSNDDLLPGDTGFTVSVDKFRGANQPTPFKVKLDVDGNGKGAWEVSGAEDRRLAELVRHVRSLEFTTQNDIALEMGVEKGTLSKWKKRAIGLELITTTEWDRCLAEAKALEKSEPAFDMSSLDEFAGGAEGYV